MDTLTLNKYTITPEEIAKRQQQASKEQQQCKHNAPLIKTFNGYKCQQCNKILEN